MSLAQKQFFSVSTEPYVRLGQACAAQPCSGVGQVVVHTQGFAAAHAQPGAEVDQEALQRMNTHQRYAASQTE
ncbi:MAG: hypothetical protein EBZ69_06815 [Alphaproteobacteria bacterium]|nr:hypothetical protein [Alphaproteobacteria bacterium]NDC56505.1 hypothetical protein [Alphaproteobacteria bacterium]NDG04714.1 hypothetical protein [Alphaproteobacteria bacterium]